MKKTHNQDQGRRAHYLANLGGLVVLAGLEDTKPNLLLGAMVRLETQLKALDSTTLLKLESIGSNLLSERNAEKRAFNAYATEQNTTRFDLTQPQVEMIIKGLGGSVPAMRTDLEVELRRLLRKKNG